MPRLETSEQKADFISKLGTKLPAPYINKITVVSDATNSFNEETSDGIEVELSVYLPAISYAKPSTLVNQIRKTNIIVAFIVGNREIDTALNSFDSVIFNYLYKVDSADTETISDNMLFIPMKDHEDPDEITVEEAADLEDGTIFALYENYVQISMSDLDEGTVDFYEDATDSYYYKFNATVTIPLTSGVSDYASDDYTQFEDFFDNAYENIDSDISYKDLEIVSFTTSLDWEALSALEKDKFLGKPARLQRLVSGITHESLFSDGTLNEGVAQEYFNVDNVIFNGTPLRDLNGVYRSADLQTRLSFFQKISGSLPLELSTETEQEIANNLSYLLSTELHSTDFLLSLQQFRSTFPDKELGFYETFRTALSSMSSEALNMEQLSPQLVRNPKIYDGRSAVDVEWEASDVTPLVSDGSEASHDLIYGMTGNDESLLNISRIAYSQISKAGGAAAFTWEDEDTICNYGYFAFDYNRCLEKDTAIAQVFDTDKLKLWFGTQMITSCLLLDNTVLHRYSAGSATSDSTATSYSRESFLELLDGHADYHKLKMTTQYSYGPDENPDDGPLNPSAGDWEGLSVESMTHEPTVDESSDSQAEVDYGTENTSDISYCVLRNVVFPGLSDSYADQPMMIFEFQDYYLSGYGDGKVTLSDDTISKEYYEVNITLQDVSINVMNQITASYKIAMDYLQEYYDMANEACSYDETIGAFNQSFVDNINEFYADDLQNAPWLRCPVIYNIHRDIILNQFEGDSLLLIEDCNLKSTRIDPNNGNIDQIELFMEEYEAFYNKFYNPGEGDGTSAGALASLIASAETDVTDGTIELTYKSYFTYLTDIYYAGETEEDYLDDVATTPAYGFMGIPGTYDNWYEARASGGDAGHPKNAEFEDADTLSQDAVKSELRDGTLFELWLPWIDGIAAATDVPTLEWAKEIFTLLMTPAGKTWTEYANSLTYYVYSNNGYGSQTFSALWYYGLSNTTMALRVAGFYSFETYWEDIAGPVAGTTDYENLVFSNEGIYSPMNATFLAAALMWPMANQESPTYGENSLVTDMWDFLGIDKDTYGS
jgi:hypothetical protein